MHPLIQRLLIDGPVITDGAWGTELQARGLPVGEFPDLWNIEFPSRVLEVAAAYVDAGSQVILTNTFGSNRFRLAEAGKADEVRTINRLGVEISKKAAEGRALVFASIGPSGKMLLNGDVTHDELRVCFTEQCQALAQADALVIETMSDLDEGTIAIEAARETGLPVIGCVVFDSGKDKDRTMMGNTPEQAAERLARAGASVIGANCGQGIETAINVCRRLFSASGLPVWIKPNAGLPELKEGRAHYRTSPQEFAAFVPELVRAGARFVGGCCGTSPKFIHAVNEALREHQRLCA
jgi:5-methyltetrahydrofolate--homocysteine methyltransferase